jgi:hypothetical protein
MVLPHGKRKHVKLPHPACTHRVIEDGLSEKPTKYVITIDKVLLLYVIAIGKDL